LAEVVKLDKVGIAGAVGLAAAALNAGRVVILPTDTVYGLTAATFRLKDIVKLREGGAGSPWREPVGKLYAVKGRPRHQPSIVLAPDWQYARMLTRQSLDRVEDFCRRVPDPISVIVEARENWRPPTTNAAGAIALRVPKSGLIRIMLKFCKFVYSVSANYPTAEEPQVLEQVPAAILDKATLAIDAGRTALPRASFVLDFTVEPPKPVRGGEQLEETLERFWR
jgi:L-threonylcarbamoyladenylate synthase